MLSPLGDQMKMMILLIAFICCITLNLTTVTAQKAAVQEINNHEQVLKNYEMSNNTKYSIVSMVNLFGTSGYVISAAEKFKAPKAGWTLQGINIGAWDGFNGSQNSIPRAGIFLLEIRDKDRNLLYQFADEQIPYTNFVYNQTSVDSMIINLPPISVSDEFYVCIYDRGTFGLLATWTNTTGNSYFYNRGGDEMIQATLPIAENTTTPINWAMQVIGS